MKLKEKERKREKLQGNTTPHVIDSYCCGSFLL